ncbi:MAG: hypothetical protein IPN76_00745 [Saprospiraceae bacterium]|nr:hypothetical protein [Saprospiraceae bacterium]
MSSALRHRAGRASRRLSTDGWTICARTIIAVLNGYSPLHFAAKARANGSPADQFINAALKWFEEQAASEVQHFE